MTTEAKKVVVVTGASAGLGRTIVREFAKKGADVALIARGLDDVWVNNAMNSVFSPIKDMKPDEYKRVTEVTYLGQVYGALAALKRMQPRNRGSIIFVGSALAYRGIPLQSAYCAAKHAIQGFYDFLRAELMHDKSKSLYRLRNSGSAFACP